MKKNKPNFQFHNHVTPKHIEHLFLKIEYDRWYKLSELRSILRENLGVEGSDIVQRNIETWSLAGIGKTQLIEDRYQSYIFQLTGLGKQVQEIYSTNRDLFFDLIHFLFYSAWYRSHDRFRGRFWVYASVCNELWSEAPSKMDSFALTAKLQSESQDLFPDSEPAFPEQGVRSVFPWLAALQPPFLERSESSNKYISRRRTSCTPQLFHLATDLIYSTKLIRYGTSLSVDEVTIEAISRTCLLDPSQFWEMADRAKMSIRGFEIRKGQWGTSIALEVPPTWIELPELKPISPQQNLQEGTKNELT